MIAIGTATDPYQPAERRYQMTRSILEEFANHEGYDIGIVTKSNLVVRDVDVLRRIAERNKLYVNVRLRRSIAGWHICWSRGRRVPICASKLCAI